MDTTLERKAGTMPQRLGRRPGMTLVVPTHPSLDEGGTRRMRSARDQTMVREYPDPNAYRRDAAKLAKKGWEVVSAMERAQRAGVGRLLLIGILSLLRPPKPTIVVTYRRAARPGAPMPVALGAGAWGSPQGRQPVQRKRSGLGTILLWVVVILVVLMVIGSIG